MLPVFAIGLWLCHDVPVDVAVVGHASALQADVHMHSTAPPDPAAGCIGAGAVQAAVIRQDGLLGLGHLCLAARDVLLHGLHLLLSAPPPRYSAQHESLLGSL